MTKSETIVRNTADDIRIRRKERGTRTDWRRLDALTDEDVEAQALADYEEHGYPDQDGPSWAGIPPGVGVAKKQVTVRLDEDILAWFKSQGKGYQTRMNAVLRQYMEHGKKAG